MTVKYWQTGLPDFSWSIQRTKMGDKYTKSPTNYQRAIKYTKWPKNRPNGI
jgi:hypothetical protein